MSPKVQMQQLRSTIKTMQRQRVQMIGAFQDAFRTLQGRFDDIAKAVTILGNGNQEVLDLVQVQSKDGTDEDSSGTEKPRILSLPGHGDDSGVAADAPSDEDKASSQAPESGGADR